MTFSLSCLCKCFANLDQIYHGGVVHKYACTYMRKISVKRTSCPNCEFILWTPLRASNRVLMLFHSAWLLTKMAKSKHWNALCSMCSKASYVPCYNQLTAVWMVACKCNNAGWLDLSWLTSDIFLCVRCICVPLVILPWSCTFINWSDVFVAFYCISFLWSISLSTAKCILHTKKWIHEKDVPVYENMHLPVHICGFFF